MIADRLLKSGLASSYLTASVQDYVQLCVEALARFSGTPEASRILSNLSRVCQGGIPEKEPDLGAAEEAKARSAWASAKAPSTIVIETAIFTSPVQVKAVIEKHNYDSVIIRIFVKCFLPNEFRFESLKVCLTCASVARELLVANEDELLFSNNDQIKDFTISFVPQAQDIGKTLQITSVLMGLSQFEGRLAVLKFSGLGVDPSTNISELLFFKQLSGVEKDFALVKPVLSCIISRRAALLSMTIDSSPPAMFGEWYPVRIKLKNGESSPTNQTVFSFNLSQGPECDVLSMESNEKLSLPFTLPLGDLSPDITLERGFFVRMTSLESRTLEFKVSYTVGGHVCLIESSVQTDVIEAFKVEPKYIGLMFEPLSRLRDRETCLFHVTISSQSPVPVIFKSSSLRLSPWLALNGSYEDVLSGVGLKSGESSCIAVALTPDPFQAKNSAEPGELVIAWSREGETALTESIIKLPSIEVDDTPLTISMNTEPVGYFMSLLPVTYTLTNHSPYLLTLSLNVDASASFMFAGQKQMVLYIQPGTSKELRYNLFPLYCGVVSLPKLKLVPSAECQAVAKLPDLNELIERTLPPTIFILPKAKVKDSSEKKEGSESKT